MPIYEYACKSCGERLEVAQSFSEDPLTTCRVCGGPLRKVFGSISIAFKGSGFYRTDARPGAAKAERAESDGKSDKDDKPDKDDKADKTEKGDKAKSETTPAKADKTSSSSGGSSSSSPDGTKSSGATKSSGSTDSAKAKSA